VGDALPVFDGLALAAASRTGAAGSDGADGGWCDVAAVDDGHVVALAVGNTGRGPGTVARVREALAALAPQRHSPAAVLAGLERAVRRGPGASGSTALCVTLDLAAGALTWAGAGSRTPLVVDAAGARFLPGGRAAPLGGSPTQRFVEAEEPIAAGSTVVLLADGPDAGPSTPDDLAAAAQGHELTPEALAAALLDRSVPTGTGLTVLVARVMPRPIEERLPADPRRLATVRRTVRAWSALAALPDERTADLQLLLCEAASNSVEHAYRETEAGEFVYSVRRRADGGIRVAVQDFGRWRPPPADPGYRGRGLALIHNLAEDVSVDVGDSGTRVAFTVPPDAPPAAAGATG